MTTSRRNANPKCHRNGERKNCQLQIIGQRVFRDCKKKGWTARCDVVWEMGKWVECAWQMQKFIFVLIIAYYTLHCSSKLYPLDNICAYQACDSLSKFAILSLEQKFEKFLHHFSHVITVEGIEIHVFQNKFTSVHITNVMVSFGIGLLDLGEDSGG